MIDTDSLSDTERLVSSQSVMRLRETTKLCASCCSQRSFQICARARLDSVAAAAICQLYYHTSAEQIVEVKSSLMTAYHVHSRLECDRLHADRPTRYCSRCEWKDTPDRHGWRADPSCSGTRKLKLCHGIWLVLFASFTHAYRHQSQPVRDRERCCYSCYTPLALCMAVSDGWDEDVWRGRGANRDWGCGDRGVVECSLAALPLPLLPAECA